MVITPYGYLQSNSIPGERNAKIPICGWVVSFFISSAPDILVQSHCGINADTEFWIITYRSHKAGV